VDPEAGFVYNMILAAREAVTQIFNQFLYTRWLGKGFVFQMLLKNTYLPTLLVRIYSNEEWLTGKVRSDNLFHGKSPFICFYFSSTE
jgi:hypothetical protein